MLPVPQRAPLAAQVVDILRREMAGGKWNGCLPGERSLSDSLQISRSTLHEALLILQREGWIELAHGRRTRILHGARKPLRRQTLQVVAALLPEPLIARSLPNVLQINQLQDSLQKAGLRLEVHFNSRFGVQGPSRRIQSLVQQDKAACWVLFSASQAVQHWFAAKRVPCLVDGFTHDGIHLPSIDIDHTAACRHAVGKFIGAGHRRIVFLRPKTESAGDRASSRAFIEAAHQSSCPDVVARIAYADHTVDGAVNAVRALLQSDERWTGFLVSEPRCSLTVASYLLRCGLRVPEDVAVISREHDEFLWRHLPSIAGYEYDLKLYAHRLSHLVIALARGGSLSARPVRILPRFHPGDSFGPPSPA